MRDPIYPPEDEQIEAFGVLVFKVTKLMDWLAFDIEGGEMALGHHLRCELDDMQLMAKESC